jgi:hypothetical protein
LKNTFKTFILIFAVLISGGFLAQNNTFSPYSRYGLGEFNQNTFAHNLGMGGAHIALKPDSTMPVFINNGNPAAYALIKLTSLEVGGTFVRSIFSNNNSEVKKFTTNFSYGALGFPIRKNGGACFGIMPFSNVGYSLQNNVSENVIGQVTYKYNGAGGLNKAFLGYGIMPFKNSLTKFKKRHPLNDTVLPLTAKAYRARKLLNGVLSDLSIGFNVNYLFGNISHSTKIEYPNSVLYNNTYRERSFNMGDFTGNFGLQTAISIDSAKSKTAVSAKRLMKEKVKFTFGYFMALNNSLKVNYDATIYNYVIDGFGTERIRDTVLYSINQKSTISLPLEQGFGFGFKKGERINAVADFAFTNWQNFKFLENTSNLKDNYRIAAGINLLN